MVFRVWLPAIVLLSVLSACTQQEHSEGKEPPAGQSAEVLRVVDGDTINVRLWSGEDESVRIIGIDAPEMRFGEKTPDCFASEAKDALQAYVQTGSITLVPQPGDNRDKYGRLLRYIEAGGQDIGALLLAKGFVRNFPWFPHPRRGDYGDITEDAERAGAGVWGECG